jgi:receptor expression-enhancing protein 5/6
VAEPFADTAVKLGIPPRTLGALVAAAATLFVLTVLDISVYSLAAFAAFVYPAWMSFKSIESGTDTQKVEWLSYWCVYGCFNALTRVTDVAFFWLPYYRVGKLAALVWCFAPQTRGAALVYKRVLRPLLHSHTETIDHGIDVVRKYSVQASSELRDASSQVVRDVALGAHQYLVKSAFDSAVNENAAAIVEEIDDDGSDDGSDDGGTHARRGATRLRAPSESSDSGGGGPSDQSVRDRRRR